MDAIEEIIAKLEKYPKLKYESDHNSVTVFPASDSGFEVRFEEEEYDLYKVYFESWHEDFENKDDAMQCFAFGLSSECRLKEFRRGESVYKWTVEYCQDGKWLEDSPTGLIFYPFWLKKEIRYFQNDLIQ